VEEPDAAGEQIGGGFTLQRVGGDADVGGERIEMRRGAPDRAEQVAGKCGTQRQIIGRNPVLIGANAAVEALRHPLDLLPDTQIAGTHLAQGAVEIAEHRIEKRLSQRIRLRALRFETLKIQESMQADQLEPSVEGVGYAVSGIEDGLPRLFDDPSVSEFGSIAYGLSAAKQNHSARATPKVDSRRRPAEAVAAKGAGDLFASTRSRVTSINNLLFRRTMRDAPRFYFLAASVAAVVAVAACAPDVEQRGDLPTKAEIAQIHPGKTTKHQVIDILGSPSSVGVFDSDHWYYISKRTSQTGIFLPDTLDQQVYIVAFDKAGVVRAVEHKGLKDAENISPAPGATPAPGRELTFVEQIIGNIGRVGGNGGTSATSPGEEH
jgi:outer membrane protein assembly factor BamE (lipoprotein component of BamABCDE complex)